MTATLHRGDLVSIRILPPWTDEISYGVSFISGPAFYRFASAVTHQGPTGTVTAVVHTPTGDVTTHLLRGFDTNTMRIIGTYADAVWGQQTTITFFEAPSGLRDGWHFGVSNLHSDAMPLLLELVHQTEQGPLRQFSLALLLPGMSISQCIAYNTGNHWHGFDFQRVLLFNHRPMEEDRLYTTETPPPGTLVTISIGDPGGQILPHGEPLPGVSSESDESDFGQYTMSYVTPPSAIVLRPNAGIVLDNDDDIPYERHFSNGDHFSGRIIPPPRWHEQPMVRQAASDGAVGRDNNGELMIQLLAYPTWRAWRETTQGYHHQSPAGCAVIGPVEKIME